MSGRSKDAKSLGALGERLALKHLRDLGYDILARNYRTPSGEIDLIAYDGDVLAFIEVKTRTSRDFGEPFEAVDEKKRAKLQKLADGFRADHSLSDCSYRFDVVSIFIDESGSAKIQLFKNAF